MSFVPMIKAIVRIPKEPPGVHARRRWRKAKPDSKDAEDADMVYNPEEGWDADTESFGVARDLLTGEEVQRRAFLRSPRILVYHACGFLMGRGPQVWCSRRRW